MTFPANTGISVDIPLPADNPEDGSGPSETPETSAIFRALFAEELGLVLEVMEDNVTKVVAAYKEAGVPTIILGKGTTNTTANIRVGGQIVLSEDVRILRDIWEQTSFELEKL